MNNQIKTIFLLVLVTFLFILIGGFLGGRQGSFIALLFAISINFFSYWYSDKVVLKMYKAKEAGQKEFSELYIIIRSLTLKAHMPIPRIFIVDQEAPNAFATGRNEENAVVVVTKGLLKFMNKEELSGVLAHELAHIKNRDILIGTLVATFVAAIMMLASMARWSAIFGGGHKGNDDDNGGVGVIGLVTISILAPIAATVIQMAVSRNREYLADSRGASIVGSPKGLATALQKLGSYSGQAKIYENPSTAHMFIVNPLSGKRFQSLFCTHPPINDRVRKLLGKTSDPIERSNMNNKVRNTETIEKEFWDRLNR